VDIDSIYLVAALIVGVLGGYAQDRVNRDFTSENTNEKSISRDTNAILRR
jgi:hypothetical protein